jgi:hypothetical protein
MVVRLDIGFSNFEWQITRSRPQRRKAEKEAH